MLLFLNCMTLAYVASLKIVGIAAMDSGDTSIDLSAVTRADSSAVSVLLSWERYAKEKGLTLQIVHVSSSLESLLVLYGVRSLFDRIIVRDN